MISNIKYLFNLVLVTVIALCFLNSCTEEVGHSRTNSLDYVGNNSLLSDRAERIKSVWSPAKTISETIAFSHFGKQSFDLVNDGIGGSVAAWGGYDTSSQLGMRTSINDPWILKNLGFSQNKQSSRVTLHQNPYASAIFAVWFDGGAYVSRYTAVDGWSSPLLLADSFDFWDYRVVIDTQNNATFFWTAYAENRSQEIHARKMDRFGNLSLVDTYISTLPAEFAWNFKFVDAAIKTDGNIDIFWSENHDINSGPTSYAKMQFWKSTYTPTKTGLSAWTDLEIIPNFFLESSGWVNDIYKIDKGNDDLLFIFDVEPLFDNTIFMSIEYNNGIWSDISAITLPTMGSTLLSKPASNAVGETVIAFVDFLHTPVAPPAKENIESQIFVLKHSPASGWTIPEKINNSNPIENRGLNLSTGDEPKVSINNAGQIAVVWIDPLDVVDNLYTNFYDVAAGWRGEELAYSLTSNQLRGFNTIVSPSGDATVLWTEALLNTNLPGSERTILMQYTDHIAPTNGVVANVVKQSKAVPKLISPLFAKPVPRRVIQRVASPSLTVAPVLILPNAVRINNTSNFEAKNKNPIRTNSSWDVPTQIDNITVPKSNNRIFDPLQFMANDSGQATVLFQTLNNKSSKVPTSHIWSGNILTGGWQSEAPLSPSAPGVRSINDIIVNPSNGDFFISWGVSCPAKACSDLYISRKTNGGTWEAPEFLGSSQGSGIDLLHNSTKIGAVWVTNANSTNTLEIAYSDYDSLTGWSAADLFTPPPLISAPVTPPTSPIPPAPITPLSHNQL